MGDASSGGPRSKGPSDSRRGIAGGTQPASIVWEEALTLAFIDLRQFHAGHTLVIPRRHLADVRELDHATGAALMASVARVSRAVAAAFPNRATRNSYADILRSYLD